MISSLPPGKLKFKFDHKKLNCRSTEELAPLEGIIGQDRAVKALKFGLNIENGGFNIFVAGYSGTGRMTGVKNFVEELAKNKPIPSDWIYVNNFKNSYEPKAIKLPAGKGGVFAGNMNNFISSIRELLPKTFSSKDYTEKKESITRGSEEEKGKLLQDLRKKAHHQGFTLKTTQIGLFVVPAIAGKPMTENQYMALSQQEKDDIQRKKTGINKALQKTMNQIRDLDRRISEETKKLNHEVALYTIGKFVNDIRQDYKNNPGIQEYMKEVEKDILNNINNFIPAKPSNGVKADYDLVMKRDKNNIEKYARFICTLCIKDNLNHLKSSSVARVLEYGIRLSGDQNKISTRFAEISNIITEANFYSKEQGKDYIEEDHIEKAIEEKYYRSNLIQEKIKEMIYDGTILIDTTGSIIGQVNGLSVINLGDYAFGRPSRVTVSVGMGKAGIIDIERETKLGGPIHTKGVMILSGYITEKYAVDRPLNLSARIVFEQSYGGVKGDSASGAELYAMLSALSGVPINQNLAVTGSVNQKGEVQAIGGVNEKIEGFFEICKSKGLNGKQGVLIPHSNIKNLMLKDEVIKAVEADNFHIYGVKTIDEGIEILTGVKAGKRGKTGKFPRNSINSEVDEKIKEFTDKLNKLSAQKEGSKDL